MDLNTKPVNTGNAKSQINCQLCDGTGEIKIKKDGGRVETMKCSCQSGRGGLIQK